MNNGETLWKTENVVFCFRAILYLRIYNNKKVTFVQDLFSAAAVGEQSINTTVQVKLILLVGPQKKS